VLLFQGLTLQLIIVRTISLRLPNAIKRQPGALKLPHTQGPGRGPTIFGVLYATLPYFLHKRLFPGLEPVTFQSHDNNFTSCAKVTPQVAKCHKMVKSYAPRNLNSMINFMHLTSWNMAYNRIYWHDGDNICSLA